MARFQLIDSMLFCEGNDARATGVLEGHYILVAAVGSTAQGDYLFDERLLKQGVVVREGKLLRFVVDFPFPNPTTASNYILGDKGDGWAKWKNANQQSLRQLMELSGWGWLIG